MPRSKRKFEGEDEAAASQLNQDNARSIPTAETQDLYGAMRRIEEQLSLSDQLRLRSGPPSGDEHGDFLRPPSPSLAPTSPRSPSCPSTTFSLTRGFDDVGLDEEEPRAKRRAVRHGPLDALDRAKAALMRKLGACADCRFRKVKCTHFDRTKFEARYQASKRGEQARLRYPEQLGVQAAVSPQPSFNNGTVTQIGSWQPPSDLPQTAPGIQHDEAEAEILAIEEGVRGAASSSASSSAPTNAPYYFANPQRMSQYSFNSMNSLSPYLAPPSQFSFGPAAEEDTHMPIGRRVVEEQSVIRFECRHGDDNTSDVVDEATVCNLRFASIPELCQHFQTDHLPFSKTFSLRKCIVRRIDDDGRERVCGCLTDEMSNRCMWCDGNTWEIWYYCTVIRTPSLTSGPSLRVGSRDGSLFGGPWPFGSSYPFGSSSAQPDVQLLFPGRYMGPNQPGSYHSFGAKAKSPDSKARDRCFRPVKVYPHGCPYGKKCRGLARPSAHITRAQVLLAISSVFSLVIMEQWLVTGASLIGSRGLASAVDAVRHHVFWMSLLCLVAGFSGMWLFKHVRTIRNSKASSCDKRCIARGFFGDSPKLDIEDAGSIRGDDDAIDTVGAGWGRRASKLMVD
ncbi:hypothetical protein QBC47DRAFT_374280 [Echria macrotheca]|uniref:Uncharacterized protein n=1 Tax=Echria macrotheca TaxID=438768 RepID=A0AAJ0BI23_9PEZI|nr:hypothetical protein QBC47DRAFT_374280 [Echria macrotheca]